MANEVKKVTFMGNPLTLIGHEAVPGSMFPQNITLLTNDLKPFDISKEAGIKIITTAPSLDTPVCDMHIRKFNEKAAGLKAKIFAVSADLPFAQARWCGASGVTNVKTLSDHMHMGLAEALGVHIKELRLLARAVFVVDSSGKIVYREIVPEVTSEPNYAEALKAVGNAF